MYIRDLEKPKQIRQTICLLFVYVVISQQVTFAQNTNTDSVVESGHHYYEQKRITYRSFIIPASLITIGTLGATGNFIISDRKIKEARDRSFPLFHTTADNYLQFLPMASGYAFLINNPEHRVLKYTEKVVLTEVIVTGLTQGVKHMAKRPRPDTGEQNSFPSGHTSQAFAGATVFCDEFAQHNTWLAITAYTSASAVGVLRVLNNRHWASDVVAGAGFGILSAKLSELIIEPHGRKYHSLYNQSF